MNYNLHFPITKRVYTNKCTNSFIIKYYFVEAATSSALDSQDLLLGFLTSA